MTNEEARKEAALDEFAKAALVGLLAGPEPWRFTYTGCATITDIADAAWAIARAMLDTKDGGTRYK